MDNNKAFWERTAKLYGPIQERTNKKLYSEIIELCGPYITPKANVLELACGTGQLSLSLYKKAKYYEATDFSEKMIIEMKRRCENIKASVQDATHLEFKEKSFDVVIIANALHIMPEPSKALCEIKRVLKDNGAIIAPTFVYDGKINKFRMFITNLVGFKTFSKWNFDEYKSFIEKSDLKTVKEKLLPGSPLPVGFIVAKKN